jgi:two-component system, NarL family, response regulator
MPKTGNQTIRILIVDDHPVVRAGLASMLGTQADLHVVGAASGGEEALKLLQRESVDVILLDLRMPGMKGIDVLRRLGTMPSAPRVIILTSYETDEDIYRAVQAGAQGYLVKDTPQKEMIEAITAVHSGKRYIPRHIIEILEMLAKGLTNKEIGSALQISDNTVRNHVISIIEKLEVSDRTEAATAAIQRGIISSGE